MISWLSCGLVLAFVAGPLSVSSRSYSNGLIFYELKSHQPYLPPTVSVSRGRNLASVKYSDKGSIWSTFGQPCECRGPVCGCCAGLKVDQYRFDQKVCANVTFVPHLEEAQLEMYVNEKATSKFGLSVRNPAPFCIPVMMGVPMAMCVQMTDVQMVDNRLRMCMDFVVRLATTDLFEMHFQCMRMGLDGLQYVDKNGKPVLPPAQQADNDDDADAGEEYGEYAELENEPEEYPLAEDPTAEKEKPKPAPAQDYQPVAYPSLAYQPQVDDSEKTPSEDESLAYQPPKMAEKEEKEEEEPEPLPIESEMLIAGDQVEEPEENDEELEDEAEAAEAEEAKKETEKEVEKEKEPVEATPDNDNGSESGPGPSQVIETITNSIKAIEEMPATTTTIKATTAPTTTTTSTTKIPVTTTTTKSKMETTNNKPNNVVIDDKDQEVSSKQEEAPAEKEKEKEEVKMSSEDREEETEDEEEEEVEEDEEGVGEESTTTEAVELENDSDNEVNVDDDDADGGAKKGQVKEPPTKAELEEKREPEKETAAAGNELKVIKPGSAPNTEAVGDQETEEGAEEEEAAEEGTDEDTEDDEEEEYEDDEENGQNLDEKKAEKLVVEADQPLEGNEYQYNLENLENRDAKLAAKSAVTRSKAAKSLSRHGRQRLQRRPLKKRH